MNEILFGDCRKGLQEFARRGVVAQTCVTSPPYYGLRDYGTATWEGGDPDCKHQVGKQVPQTKDPHAIKAGVRLGVDASHCIVCGAKRIDSQIGLEKTPEEYVASLVEVFRDVWKVLADDGTLWLNLGDSYCSLGGSHNGRSDNQSGVGAGKRQWGMDARPLPTNEMLARAKPSYDLKPKDLIGIPWRVAFALQEDGWYLRQDIIWSKNNPLPESVRDRCTKSHEYIFLLSKNQRYFFDHEAIREPATTRSEKIDWRDRDYGTGMGLGELNGEGSYKRGTPTVPIGTAADGLRNKRSVWNVNPKPYKGAHFATYPPELIKPCILAGSRPGDIVLDPFMGSGTTAQVAVELGRQYIGCELNEDFKKLQDERIAKAFPDITFL